MSWILSSPFRSASLSSAGVGLLGFLLSVTGVAPPLLAATEPFPEAAAESVGLPGKALVLLADQVQAMVDSEEIVGGELLVIKNRRTVLRRAFGFKDREAEAQLATDSVYCVRSMTKPLVGTAVQMLIDEGRLRLETPIHEVLPAFAGTPKEAITLEHLLTHSGGFPLTTISQPLSAYTDLSAVAAEAAASDLLFEPGSRFSYSDASSDILGAIVAKVTGAPPEVIVQDRILDPLGMRDSFALIGGKQAVKERIPSAYSGGTGKWSRHWKPADPPIFPLFLTSQSLYATTTDYARFLALWMDGGRLGDHQLLSSAAVERALAPAHSMEDYPTGGDGIEVAYGQHWIVYRQPPESGGPASTAFGHDGSDGTFAWAWPDEDLMVLFFTQSRGTLAGLRLHRLAQTLLIDQKLDDPALVAQKPVAGALDQVSGLYWDESVPHAYYVVAPRGDGLTLERPGRMRLVFVPGTAADEFVHEAGDSARLVFERGGDGSVVAMRTHFGSEVELDPRHVPAPDLPSVEAVVERVQSAHRIDLLSELGPVRMTGRVNLATRQLEGRITRLFDADRQRTKLDFGGVEEVVVTSGGRGWTASTATGREELHGERLEQALLDHFSALFGDWREHYEHVEVLKRAPRREGAPVLIVRVVPREAPGATVYVDEDTGRVLYSFGLVQVPGLGIVGVQNRFEDYREVGGMTLPFRTVSKFASNLIGRVEVTIEKAAVGARVGKRDFSAP